MLAMSATGSGCVQEGPPPCGATMQPVAAAKEPASKKFTTSRPRMTEEIRRLECMIAKHQQQIDALWEQRQVLRAQRHAAQIAVDQCLALLHLGVPCSRVRTPRPAVAAALHQTAPGLVQPSAACPTGRFTWSKCARS